MVKEAFPIIHPKIRLEIKLEKVENLHIHEEVIPNILHKLTEDIRADNLFKHPVIVDSKTLVVLDGMHRVAATKNLGYRFIPVCQPGMLDSPAESGSRIHQFDRAGQHGGRIVQTDCTYIPPTLEIPQAPCETCFFEFYGAR